MAFFQSSIERTRHASTDAVLETGREILNDTAVIQALGEQGVALRALLETGIYVPNIRHGVIRKPRHTSEEMVPIMSTFSDDDGLVLDQKDMLDMTPFQVERARTYLSTQGVGESMAKYIVDLASRRLENVPDIGRFEINRDERAAVLVRRASIKVPRSDKRVIERLFINRPITLFRVGHEDDQTAGFDVVHELTHINQYLHDVIQHPHPEQQYRIRTKKELEAYHYSAVATEALYNNSQNPDYYQNDDRLDITSLLIEKARKRVNEKKNDPFSGGDELYSELISDFEMIGKPPVALSRDYGNKP